MLKLTSFRKLTSGKAYLLQGLLQISDNLKLFQFQKSIVPLNETSQFNYYPSHFYFTFSLVIFFLYLCLCYLAEFAFILTISDEEKMNANSKHWSKKSKEYEY